jgi:hypothetical protein
MFIVGVLAGGRIVGDTGLSGVGESQRVDAG